MIYYRQCTFKKDNTTQTAWIEERGAKVGARVTFKDVDDKDFWEVTVVGETRMPEAEAKLQERAYLKQRAASDI